MRSKSHAALGAPALTILREVGENIRTARTLRGMSRRELSLRCLVSEPTLAALERGSPTVSVGTLLAVLATLGLEKHLLAVANPTEDAVGLHESRRQRKKRVRQPEL